MAMQNFVVELMEGLLESGDLGLTEEDIRFYDQGTTAEEDEQLNSHIKWKNARYYNTDSNVVRSSILIVRLSTDNSSQYISFTMGGFIPEISSERPGGCSDGGTGYFEGVQG